MRPSGFSKTPGEDFFYVQEVRASEIRPLQYFSLHLSRIQMRNQSVGELSDLPRRTPLTRHH